MNADCRRVFTSHICVFTHRHAAQPPADLCDPIKGRSVVSTLSSSPRAKLCSAELDRGQVLDWRLTAAPSLTPFLLSLFKLSLSLYQSLSIPTQPFSICLSLCLPLPHPPPQCPTQQPLFPVLWSYMAAEPWVAPVASRVPHSSEEAEKKPGRSMKKSDASYVKVLSQDEAALGLFLEMYPYIPKETNVGVSWII